MKKKYVCIWFLLALTVAGVSGCGKTVDTRDRAQVPPINTGTQTGGLQPSNIPVTPAVNPSPFPSGNGGTCGNTCNSCQPAAPWGMPWMMGTCGCFGVPYPQGFSTLPIGGWLQLDCNHVLVPIQTPCGVRQQIIKLQCGKREGVLTVVTPKKPKWSVVAGTFRKKEGLAPNAQRQNPAEIFVVRVFNDGSIDKSFGKDGWVYLEEPLELGGAPVVHSVVILRKGDVVVSGKTCLPDNEKDCDLFVVRLHHDGRLDTSFGDQGWIHHRIDIDGKIILKAADRGEVAVTVQTNGGEIVVERFSP